jgi:hypothetical protein
MSRPGFKCQASTLQEFPLQSALNPEEYGPQESAIKPEHIESQLEGLTVAEVRFLSAKRGLCFVSLGRKCVESKPLVLCVEPGCGREEALRRGLP